MSLTRECLSPVTLRIRWHVFKDRISPRSLPGTSQKPQRSIYAALETHRRPARVPESQPASQSKLGVKPLFLRHRNYDLTFTHFARACLPAAARNISNIISETQTYIWILAILYMCGYIYHNFKFCVRQDSPQSKIVLPSCYSVSLFYSSASLSQIGLCPDQVFL